MITSKHARQLLLFLAFICVGQSNLFAQQLNPNNSTTHATGNLGNTVNNQTTGTSIIIGQGFNTGIEVLGERSTINFDITIEEGNSVGASVGASDGGNGTTPTVTTNCPMMMVDVDIPFLQSCIASNASVSYCNEGTADAVGSYVDVELDTALTLDTASVAFVAMGNNTYRFQIGTVPVNGCGTINIHFSTACDSNLVGLGHCINAHIYPDTVCEAVWDDYLLSLDAVCNGKDIKFSVDNHGTAVTMSQQLSFIVIDDHLLVQGGSGTIIHQGILVVGQNSTEEINLLNISSTNYKLEIRDSIGTLIASSSVQNCSSSSSLGNVYNYHAQQFTNHSTLPFDAVGCAVNGNSSTSENVSNSGTGSSDQGGGNGNNPVSNNNNNPFDAIEEPISIQVFPNPFKTSATVRIDGPVAKDFSFKLYDLTGRIVQVKNLSEQKEFVVNRENLLQGVYFYQIEAEGEQLGRGKLIVE